MLPTRWFPRRRQGLGGLLTGFLVVTRLACAAQVEPAQAPGIDQLRALWDGPAMTAKPQDLAQAVKSRPVPKDLNFDMLLQDTHFRFDERGCCTRTDRLVYRCLTSRGAQQLTQLDASWGPWYQKRPVVRVRVIDADGTSRDTDPTSIAESPVGESQQEVLSDRRMLKVPLPRLSAGSLIEEEVVTGETQPRFAPGVAETISLSVGWPTDTWRLTLDVPEALAFRYTVRDSQAQPVIQAAAGRKVLRWQQHDLAAGKGGELLAPEDAHPQPRVVFGTGVSWQAVAQAYAALVEQQCQSAQLGPVVQRVLGDTKEPRAKTAKLVEFVQRQIRYMGIEFGQSSLVPYPATTVLSRSYGDCKDQSTLLVGLLRAAGIEAHVALVRQGGPVDPDVPGITAFNHAVVYLPGSPPVWIDPISPFHPLGSIPQGDEGCWALPATKTADRPIRLPRSAAADHQVVDLYDIRLSEGRAASFVRRLKLTGEPAQQWRQQAASTSVNDIQAFWEKHAKEQYGSQGAVKAEWGPQDRCDRPWELTLTCPDAPLLGNADASTAWTRIVPDVFARIPLLVFCARIEPDGKSKVPRKYPMQIEPLQTIEKQYSVTPPPGFSPKKLPDPETRTFGPLRFSAEFREAADHRVTVIFKLDTGHGRLTAEEGERLVEFVRELSKRGDNRDGQQLIVFQQSGLSLLEKAKFREALAEFRRLRQLSPASAQYEAQYAETLMFAGFGGLARVHSRRAVAMDPKSGVAHAVLGAVLSRDSWGRPFQGDFDQAGAVAAYEQARQLQPDHESWAADTALCCEYDRWGVRYQAGVQLDKAIAIYRQLLEKSKPEGVPESLAMVLLHRGKYQEIDPLVAATPTPAMIAVQLAAIGAAQGGKAMIARSEELTLSQAQRREVLAKTSDYLASLRNFAVAAVALEAALAGLPAGTQPQWESMHSTYLATRSPPAQWLPAGSPGRLVQDLHAGLLAGGASLEQAAAAVHFDPKAVPADSHVADVQRSAHRLRNHLRGQGGEPGPWCGDFLLRLTWKQEGDARTGWRVTTTSGRANAYWYLAPQEKDFCLVNPGRSLAELGAVAQRALDGGKPEVARLWLDWAFHENQVKLSWFDPFSGSPFARLWSVTADKTNASALRLAAAALVAVGDQGHLAVAPLENGLAGAGDLQKLQIQRALVCAYRHKHIPQLIGVTGELIRKYPNVLDPCLEQAEALFRERRLAELEKLIDSRIGRLPKDAWARASRGRLALARGAHAEADKQWRAGGTLGGQDYAFLAWNALYTEPLPEQALDDAKQAIKLAPPDVNEPCCVLAAVLVHRNQLAEATEQLRECMVRRGGNEPQGDEWYVWGRLAEAYELPETAVEAYRKVTPPRRWLAATFFDLAQKRLATLTAKDRPCASLYGARH